jgi:hypothetical protein
MVVVVVGGGGGGVGRGSLGGWRKSWVGGREKGGLCVEAGLEMMVYMLMLNKKDCVVLCGPP